MIIAVSIIDKHTGKHVGTYSFEIDYSGDSHFDFLTVSADPEDEADIKASTELNKLYTKETMPNPVRAIKDPLTGEFSGTEPYE